ncbi:MAG: hypothetical protein JOZ75_09780, partial [Candidatus Dormibacteraeota bacterium]|nr:hypothetical protein [Candidatus Dormibacteraeota bacterium]
QQLPPDAPIALRASAKGDLRQSEGMRESARGELARQEARWDDAVTAYTNAQEQFNQAAAEYASAGLAPLEGQREQILNQSAMLTMTIRQIEEQRDREQGFLETIRNLERDVARRDRDYAGLVDTIGRHGVQVTNFNEARAEVEQNIQIVQRIENEARQQLQQLVDAIAATRVDPSTNEPLSEETRNALDELNQKTRQAVEEPSHGSSFLRRVGTITNQLADIVKAASIVAGPIPAIVGTLMSLVGGQMAK